MEASDIVSELRELSSEATKKVLLKHGAKEPFYGVKVEDLKKIQKRIKKNHHLALDLFSTGISDAMYLAGLIAEPDKMTKTQLQEWVEKATWSMISEYTVAWVASEAHDGQELALEWINSEKESIASSGWSTLAGIASVSPDADLDLNIYKNLLKRIVTDIHHEQNRVKYTMNGFVISVGSFVTSLHEEAVEAASKIGRVHVEMGGTACKVPFAIEYIKKVKEKGYLGKKK